MIGAQLPYYGVLAAAVLLGVLGQVLLKTGARGDSGLVQQFTDPYTIVGLGVYAMAAILYIIAIKKIPVSIAFPSVSLSYAILAVIAHYAWNEPLGVPQFAGIALIGAGILLLHQG